MRWLAGALWLGCLWACSSAYAQPPVPSHVASQLPPLHDEGGGPVPSSEDPIVESALAPSTIQSVYTQRLGALVRFVLVRQPGPVLVGGWVGESYRGDDVPAGSVWGVSHDLERVSHGQRLPLSVLHPWLPWAEVRAQEYDVAYLSNAGELLVSRGGATYITDRLDRRRPVEVPVRFEQRRPDADQVLLTRDRRVVVVLQGALGVLKEDRWTTVRWGGDGTLVRVCEDSRGDVYAAASGTEGRVLQLRADGFEERFAGDFEARTMSCLRAGGFAVIERSGSALHRGDDSVVERHGITPPLPHRPELAPARSDDVLWTWMRGGQLAALDLLPVLAPRPARAP